METIQDNARDLSTEMQWLQEVIYTSFKLYFKNPCPYETLQDVKPPSYADSCSPFATVLNKYGFGFQERVAISLALAPHIDGKSLDIFFCKNSNTDRHYSEFGGKRSNHWNGFLPTGETLAFILAGGDLQKKLELRSLFSSDHPFIRDNLVYLEPPAEGEPLFSGSLKVHEDFLDVITTGQTREPGFTAQFPAVRITTKQRWEDLVLAPVTTIQVEEILTWIEHGETLLKDWAMDARFRPGYRCLFYGPPGTGKTMTACLLGQATGREVYKIDLSMVVSKWVGETEKNLSRVFDRAQSKGWILFFDEADSLFSKRTDISSSHDRYANQEVAYLLQRIEQFDGVTILATNLKDNIDEAFTRRFESLVYFPLPQAMERKRIWEQSFSPKATLASDIDLEKISQQYNLTGATIMSVVRYASLQTLKRSQSQILLQDLIQGIRKEYAKEGKTI